MGLELSHLDMVYTSETESLLGPQNTKYRHRKRSIIVITLITIVVLIGITTGLAYGYIYWKKNIKNDKKVHLKHVLPSSFGVMFKIQTENSSDSVNGNVKEIKWENEPKTIRYHQKTEQMISNESILTDVIIINNKAAVSYKLGNQTCWMDPGDLNVFKWFSILRLIMDSIQSHYTEERCPGRMWTVPYDEQSVYICITRQQIAYIRYDDKVAKSQEWLVPSRSSIKMPKDTPKCESMNLEMPSLRMTQQTYEQNTSDSIRKKSEDIQNIGIVYEPRGQSDVFTRSTRPDCLFVHGVGVSTPKTGFKSVTSLDYWGHIERNTPQCSSHRFIQFNTVDNGWDSTLLHQMFCEFATGSNLGGSISNKIIFSHSMGNNIIAAALHRKVCTFDKQSSEWFSVSAPWRGSKVADKLQNLCAGHFGPSHHISHNILRLILGHTKFCTKAGKMSPAYKTLQPAYKSTTGVSFDDLISVASLYVNGALCGTSPWGMGLNIAFSGALDFVQGFSHLETPDDGVVALSSCDVLGRKFQKSWKDKFYMASVNHLESSTSYGCPTPLCSWYKHL
ncbi:uncharacterized protein LOC117323747 [Pecten maximus]|uniref:uncharacterized protein LOC117323747 n=1 Tax=Pecten maximus TaxID=6579 RepID=UPI0014585DE2|nr:uncharacterized protein LOC117323747 [Pecten maximus]